MNVEDLKKQRVITRTEIAELLASLGKPGENREAKLEALESLNRKNKQGHSLAETAGSYGEY